MPAPTPPSGRRWHGPKKVAQVVFNGNRYLRERYEENLCFLVPCYEVAYGMVRV